MTTNNDQDQVVHGMRIAAKIVDQFAKENPNAVLICQDVAKEIRRRAALTALRKPPKPRAPKQPKAETPA